MNFRKITPWALLVFALAYIISGLGITYYSIVEHLTFGLLTKALAFKIHIYLLIPFLIVLVAHIFLVLGDRKNKK